MVVVGLEKLQKNANSHLFVGKINLDTQVVTVIEQSAEFHMTRSHSQYRNCTIDQNCLDIITECIYQLEMCLVVIPCLPLIIIKDEDMLTKYINPNLSIEHVLGSRLFPKSKKLVIVHNQKNESQTVNILVLRFDSSIKKRYLVQNYVKLVKNVHFKSVYEMVRNDRNCLDISQDIFSVLIFYRLFHLQVCFVYINRTVACFTLIENDSVLPVFFPSNSDEGKSKDRRILSMKNCLLFLSLHFACFLILMVKKFSVNYQNHLFNPRLIRRHTSR